MHVTHFDARADLIGGRIRLSWTVRFEAGETLADAPVVRLRRKERDYQFPPPEPGLPDAFGVYDAAAFPPAGTTLGVLPVEEHRADATRVVTETVSVQRSDGLRLAEVLRRTWTTTFGLDGLPRERHVEVIDFGDSIGGLVPLTTYYYRLEQPDTAAAPSHESSARAGIPYALGRHLYGLLPAVHRRYDDVPRTLTPGAEAMTEALPTGGQLQRLTALFGSALDLMRSHAEGLPALRDIDRTDARYLPLLARWIGWNPRFDQPIPVRRHEIKYAAALYRLTGSVPSLHLWAQQATGWPVRVKEYVHNTFRTNDPPQHAPWLRERRAGAWTAPEQPLVPDAAVAGRPAPVVDADGTLWLFYHTFRRRRWGIWAKTRRPGEPWTTSTPLSAGPTLDRYPAAALRADGSLWLFWSAYDPAAGRWHLFGRVRDAAGTWGEAARVGPEAADRRHPAVTVAADGSLWLAWMERGAARWHLRYARHDGAWSPPVTLPPDGGAAVRVEGRPALLAFDAAGARLWLAFTQEVATGDPGQSRRTVVVRSKADLTADAGAWSAVDHVSARPPTFHDDDPALFVDEAGAMELVYASDRVAGWSLWARTYDAPNAAWGPEEALPRTPYDERDPAPIAFDGADVLAYRSHRSPVYESPENGGIRSVDFRYAGSATPRLRNAEALALRGSFDDFGSYTYDVGGATRTDADRYADDTVGLFLRPDTVDATALAAGVGRLRQVVALTLPATERAVVLPEPDLHVEHVYGYRRGTLPRIDDDYLDTFTSVLGTTVLGDAFDFSDSLEP